MVINLLSGIFSNFGNTSSSLSSVSAPFQLRVMGKRLRMAHMMVHPLAHASSAFSVVLGSFWKVSWTMRLMAGMRVEPPTISTTAMSSGLKLASTKSRCNAFCTRANIGSDSLSKSSLLILALTSMSLRKHSMFSGMGDELADISFFTFSHSVLSLRRARTFE
ncbi:hypothetical protein BpHYR1_027645 [Brachionus plicatilis]|uniref:Uncharacterized protein n=1 Tax=Brachionus plicatilis TaxID=10195 RepID=A0A3M7S3E8_BRAPC|nr:hypothetical protein BpHYR1_027645 [Brachionus plicatilis]